MGDTERKRTALISVSDKSRIASFAQSLVELGFVIYGSRGTAKYLNDVGILTIDVSELVGGEAILGHRVVTLSREVHAGLLARDIADDIAELERLGIPRLDLVCVDMYPLELEITRPGATMESVTEQTDIGGPTMIRSGAKGRRIVVCDSADQDHVLAWLKAGEPDDGFLLDLAAKAEFTVAKYVGASAVFLGQGKYVASFGKKVADCKGENEWQKGAALYTSSSTDPLAVPAFDLVGGIAPSYNTWRFLDRGLQSITHVAAIWDKNFGRVPFIAIGSKHGNPCGAAVEDRPEDALVRMMAGNPRAIMGGFVITNFPLDDSCIEVLVGKKLDAIAAPRFSKSAVEALRRKGDKCRFLQNPALRDIDQTSLDTSVLEQPVRGGRLCQPNYTHIPGLTDALREVSQIDVRCGRVTEQILQDIALACAIGSTSDSNTITLVNEHMLISNSVGQQDRFTAARLAVSIAQGSGHDTRRSSGYGDSFFPFKDGPKELADAGVRAILASSGSVNDKETIDFCGESGVTLLMVPDAIGRGFFGH